MGVRNRECDLSLCPAEWFRCIHKRERKENGGKRFSSHFGVTESYFSKGKNVCGHTHSHDRPSKPEGEMKPREVTLNEGNVRERPTILISQVNTHAQTWATIIMDKRDHSFHTNTKTNCQMKGESVSGPIYVVCMYEREIGKVLINCNILPVGIFKGIIQVKCMLKGSIINSVYNIII